MHTHGPQGVIIVSKLIYVSSNTYLLIYLSRNSYADIFAKLAVRRLRHSFLFEGM